MSPVLLAAGEAARAVHVARAALAYLLRHGRRADRPGPGTRALGRGHRAPGALLRGAPDRAAPGVTGAGPQDVTLRTRDVEGEGAPHLSHRAARDLAAIGQHARDATGVVRVGGAAACHEGECGQKRRDDSHERYRLLTGSRRE